jgi:hypothetical protein
MKRTKDAIALRELIENAEVALKDEHARAWTQGFRNRIDAINKRVKTMDSLDCDDGVLERGHVLIHRYNSHDFPPHKDQDPKRVTALELAARVKGAADIEQREILRGDITYVNDMFDSAMSTRSSRHSSSCSACRWRRSARSRLSW